MWGWRDSGYDGLHLLYGASEPHAGRIFYVNAITLAVDDEFDGCGFETCHGLAVVSAASGTIRYKVTTYLDTLMETREWVVGSPAATLVDACQVAAETPYGLAYDSGHDSIWVAHYPSAGSTLWELDPETCAVKGHYDQTPEILFSGGAAMALTSHGCNLWTLCQCDPSDVVFAWATGGHNPFACGGVTSIEPATWGSIKANYK